MNHTLTLLAALLLTPLLWAANATHSTVDTQGKPLKTLVVANKAGLRWELSRTKDGWSLGGIYFHEKLVEQPATNGLLALRNLKSGEVRWMAASKEEKLDPQTARLSGQEAIDGVTFSYTVTVDLSADMPAARLTAAWSVDKDLNGWEVCLAYHDGFANDWRVQSYPWAGNSEKLAISPMRYCGVPGVLVYRPDQSLVALFAIDSNSDYLNPTTWTGKTDFHFANRSIAPQFRVGGGKLSAGIKYEMPLQLFLSDAGGFSGAITGIMQAWIKLNKYKVDDSLKVRTPQEAFDLALEGRRNMASWKPGIGYEHHKGTPFVYVGNNPFIAYYEYRQYEITGDKLWRDRAFEQIDFALKGQQPSGVFHTSWYFKRAVPEFCSLDWSHDGYKVDINVWMARYILQTWQRVKEKEGIDRQDWYKAAIASLEWVKSQQNPDGGLPQCVDIKTGKKSFSVVCGRALVGLPIIARITGDESYLKLCADMEKFLRSGVEGRFWYTGMHPDLPPGDFEQDSIYAVVEYWLDKHDRTGDKESLDHAVANAYYGLLYWCPKQLSWVKNPTQGAHSEQQHFNQYSVYSYGNRKIQCLDRLFKKTGNPLFEQLKNRVMQLNFSVQVAEGPYKGAMTEAITDPWLERKQGFEWRGNPYTSEMVSDLMLQLIEMGYVNSTRPSSAAERPRLELPERKIVVDADPADWKGVPATVVQGERHLWFGQGMTRENWKGNSDLSYSWRAAWHGDKLYFLFEVNDDKVLEPTQPSSFLNDSVEMYLDWGDRGGQRVKVMDGRPDWFSKCDPKEMLGHELHFLPTTPPRVYLDHRDKFATDKPHSDEFAKQWAGEAAVRKTATGYIMEIGFALPGVGFKPGKVMGLEVGVNDDDGQGRKSIMIWPATKSDFWLIMDEYGKIILTSGDRK